MKKERFDFAMDTATDTSTEERVDGLLFFGLHASRPSSIVVKPPSIAFSCPLEFEATKVILKYLNCDQLFPWSRWSHLPDARNPNARPHE